MINKVYVDKASELLSLAMENFVENENMSINYLRQAANLGNTDALYLIGNFYVEGNFADIKVPDYTKAKQFYELAIRNRNPEAQNRLGLLYYFGQGTPKDLAKAKMCFEKAILNGSIEAGYNLGRMYENGEGVRQNLETAIQLYKEAESKLCAKANYRLGYLSFNGIGVEKDYDLAKYWWEKQIDSFWTCFFSASEYSLCNMYRYGISVEKDSAKSDSLWEECKQILNPEMKKEIDEMFLSIIA